MKNFEQKLVFSRGSFISSYFHLINNLVKIPEKYFSQIAA